MSDNGMHDSLVWQELERLPPPVEKRVRTQILRYLARVVAMAEAQERGEPVAPRYRRSPAEQFEAEAVRLTELGDPAALVWDALASSAQLASRLQEMEPDVVP